MAGLLIAGGAAFAQGLGIGSGVDDIRSVRGTGAPSPPSAPIAQITVINTGLVGILNGFGQ